jgi:hypothetical protein
MHMIHRRLVQSGDPRGNETTIIDERMPLLFADSTALPDGGGAYLARRQVSTHLVAQARLTSLRYIYL